MAKTLLDQLNSQKRTVDFDSYDITVKELVGMVGDSLINIAPEYQRQFRWNSDRQSAFIESVFLGIPIPNLFMAANPDGTWELIDGVQRLSTLIRFISDDTVWNARLLDGPLKLTGLTKLTEFNGNTFDHLIKSVQLQFLLKPLKVTTISDKSDFEVRFDLFERLNTGGVLLTAQEIRSCIYRGEFNETLRELAHNPDFQRVVPIPQESEANGTREEHVLRFFAYLHCYKQFDHSVKDFLNSYMEKSSKSFDYSSNTQVFHEVFTRLAAALPYGITRGRKTSPVNLYEAVAVGAALAYQQSGRIITNGAQEWIGSDQLKQLTTGATNSNPMVRKRIEFCRDRFLGNDA